MGDPIRKFLLASRRGGPRPDHVARVSSYLLTSGQNEALHLILDGEHDSDRILHRSLTSISDRVVRVAPFIPRLPETLRSQLKAYILGALRSGRNAGGTVLGATVSQGGGSQPSPPTATETKGLESVHLKAAPAQGKGRKRGPKPDHEAASRVAEVVARVAPDGDWRRSKVYDVCCALDAAQIPCPATWRKKVPSCVWADYDERAHAVKAIEYRLEIAKQRKRTAPETLS